MRRSGIAGLLLALLGVSCKIASGPSVCAEGLGDGGAGDAGTIDAGDAGASDAGKSDAGASDAGAGDAGASDAGASGASDAGASGASDAGASDAGGAGDTGQHDGGLDGGASYCASCQSPTSCGTVQNPAIVAVAGLAASARHPRTFYLHNGPPELARFFAVDDTGADLGTYDVAGAANLDWEDLAVGPCPGGSCVFLADIGDAQQARGQYTVYRVAEPSSLSAGETSVTADVFPFSYPDGSHDAAAILVHPVTGVVTILTRDHTGAGTRVYELPSAAPGQAVVATSRGSIDHLGLDVAVTGASVRRDGRVLLRTDHGALLFDAPQGDAGTQPVGAAFRGASCQALVATESGGEAIAWLGSGRGYLAVDRGPAAALGYVFCAGL